MTHPTVHLNGTSRKELLEGYICAMDALDLAISALRACSPNGRDYYSQGPDAISEAVKEHVRRLEAVKQVHDEIAELAVGL